jgi:integrase
MKSHTDRAWGVRRSTRRRSDRSKRRPGPGALTEYRFENPGRALLRTTHPEEASYVDTTGEVWEHAYFGRMDWRKILVPEPLKQAMQHYAFHELEAGAPQSGFTCFVRLLAIQRVIDSKSGFPLFRERTFEILAALHNREQFNEFCRFYRWATMRGVPGFDRLTMPDIAEFRPPVQRRRVDARDSGRYLTDEEQRLLLTALDTTPAVDDPRLRDQVLVQLCWELGCRPDQVRGIDERHVHEEHIAGEEYCCVDVPRAKQRAATFEYKRRPISSQLAAKILLLVAQNRKAFGSSNASSPLFRTQPVFNIQTKQFTNRTKHYGNRLSSLSAACAIARFISERLGPKGYRGGRMLRHNMAQRMADMGAPAAAVAEALDHSNLSHVGVYVRSRPDVAELKTRALGKSRVYRDALDWLNGRIPIPRSEAASGGAVQGMVADRYIGNIGVCGLSKDKRCPYNPVYSCYGCSQFTPFIDGEHDAVADAMAQENLRLIDIAGGIDGGRVALANEYPIAAARAVQALCRDKQGTPQ